MEGRRFAEGGRGAEVHEGGGGGAEGRGER